MEKDAINKRFIDAINSLTSSNIPLKKSEIAAALSIKPSKFSEILNNRMNASAELIAVLSDKFGISTDWILNGKGSMCENLDYNDNTQNEPLNTRPRIPFEAAAGSLSIATESVKESQCERFPVIPRLPRYDFTIIVRGDSMEPDFHSGDEIACQLVRENGYIQWGRPYVIDSIDGVVLKRIHDAGDSILCTSDNPNYGNFHILKNEINHLALVVGMIRIF